MSMESIGAKIAFVRGGFGSGEMQKEGEITISRYLTQANLKRRRAPMHIWESTNLICQPVLLPMEGKERIIHWRKVIFNLIGGTGCGFWIFTSRNLSSNYEPHPPHPLAPSGCSSSSKSCKLNQSFAPFIKASSNSKEARRMIKGGVIRSEWKVFQPATIFPF